MNYISQVFLVGAGPGDPGLLTLKGKEAIEQADTIVYDRLVSPRLLEYARPDCEFIYVGKTPDNHTLSQEKINACLVKHALRGRVVVRLKGGDPFVFGRGGEEAEVLSAHGIPFTIIPGVTSAIAAPAYAGIPVTHRRSVSSFTVITGHEAPEKLETSIAWEHLSKLESTLVFLMGMKNLPLIVENLIKHGMPADTLVAVIERGTWPGQRTICGDLNSIVGKVEEYGLSNPSTIVVGKVVELRDQLIWFERSPLYRRTIVVTRARHQASALSRALESLGALVEEYPMIQIAPPPDEEALPAALEQLNTVNWAVFTSTNAVEAFFVALSRAGKTVSDLASVQVVALGPATKKALERRGVQRVFLPEEYLSEGVATFLEDKLDASARVLLVRAEDSRPVLGEAIEKSGATLIDVPAYQSVPVEEGLDNLIAALRNKQVDAVTFTSSSTVQNFMKLLGDDASLLEGVSLFSIGPITTDTMKEYHLVPTAEATSSTIDGLVEAILNSLGE